MSKKKTIQANKTKPVPACQKHTLVQPAKSTVSLEKLHPDTKFACSLSELIVK